MRPGVDARIAQPEFFGLFVDRLGLSVSRDERFGRAGFFLAIGMKILD
jgi:hypothetical protein